jgi:putative ABC transport system ATP-binding protein
MTAPAAIDARGVVKRVHVGSETKTIVAGVDLQVSAGDLVLILGRSGSGKTTLLTILGALLPQDEGRVIVLGRDLASMDPRSRRAFVRREVGFVFQAAGLMPTLTAAENVAFALYMLGEEGREVDRRAGEVLEWVGLAPRARHRGDELSGGEQQRVALARALVKQPQLLLSDEPTSQLDAESAKMVVELLKEVSLSGTTVVVATHDQTLSEVADHIVRLADGRVVGVS